MEHSIVSWMLVAVTVVMLGSIAVLVLVMVSALLKSAWDLFK
jgi:hypothetical protein